MPVYQLGFIGIFDCLPALPTEQTDSPDSWQG